MTKIEWTDATWNPVTGCTKVSPGCAYCYAERLTLRFGGKPFLPGVAEINLHEDRLTTPLRWKKPRMIFVNSMSDLFHEDVPEEFLVKVFGVMAMASQHTFQVLTKRPERMHAILTRPGVGITDEEGEHIIPDFQLGTLYAAQQICWDRHDRRAVSIQWPLPNVWLGVSVENQRWADARIPLLLETPAAVRFLSCEPLLGALEFQWNWLTGMCDNGGCGRAYSGAVELKGDCPCHDRQNAKLDWVIVGGESGGPEDRRLVERCSATVHVLCANAAAQPSTTRRPASCSGTGYRPKPQALTWVRSIRDQCVAAGVPFFFKQWGGPRSTSGGRELDGRTWDGFPE